MKPPRDPYLASLAVTLLCFYGAAALLAWVAHRWPGPFALGLAAFFLLVYGKLNFLAAPLVRARRRRGSR